MVSSNLNVVVVGLGVQGLKRAKVAKDDLVATVDTDKNSTSANYSNIDEIDDKEYEAVLLCTPDSVKYDLLKHILNKKKHVLVEKPLFFNKSQDLRELQHIANQNNVVLYTAYNHRFEPHFVNMKTILDSNELGKIYRIRMFYGNGTSALVKQSAWRDKGAGVILDIGSHLLDTLIFWFKDSEINMDHYESFCFENMSPDHALLRGKINNIFVELEVSLMSWKNDFICDVIGSKGSAHISSLCKWGPSKLIKRNRVMPAGKPDENIVTLTQSDPTWLEEYKYFKSLISNNSKNDLSTDIKIFNILKSCV